jgi:ABC-type sugar transport system substrate-binding protein
LAGRVVAVILLFGVALFVAWNWPALTSKHGKRQRIALLVPGMQTSYLPPFVEAFRKLATERHLDVSVFDAKFDEQVQLAQMMNAVTMRPSAIYLYPLRAAVMGPAIQLAYEKRIPVIVGGSRPDDEDVPLVVGHLGPDYYRQGRLCADLMNRALKGRGGVITIEGIPGQEATQARRRGFVDRLTELNSEIEILDLKPAGWQRDSAFFVMRRLLRKHGERIRGVFAQDDTMALGAWFAINQAGLGSRTPVIIGVGGSRQGLTAVKDGRLYGTVLQSPVAEAQMGFQRTCEVLLRKLRPPEQLDPFYAYVGMRVITKDNVDNFLPGDW